MEIANVTKAKMFAEVQHAGKVYNDDVPYTYHLGMVVSVLHEFGFDDTIITCSGWLHDVLEDTATSYNDLKKRFGEEVAELVYSVTNELGRNRKERNAKTYPKIKASLRATTLKLADRIANVRYSVANGGKEDMYREEFASFEEGIRDRDIETEEVARMWKALRLTLAVAQ